MGTRMRGAQKAVEQALTAQFLSTEEIEKRVSGFSNKQIGRALSALTGLKIAERSGHRYHHFYRRNPGAATAPKSLNGVHCVHDLSTGEIVIGRGDTAILLTVEEAIQLGRQLSALKA